MLKLNIQLIDNSIKELEFKESFAETEDFIKNLLLCKKKLKS